MAMKFRLILLQNGRHNPRIDEPVFPTEEEAQQEKLDRETRLHGLPDKGYKYQIVSEGRTPNSLVKHFGKPQSLGKRKGARSKKPMPAKEE
jgi:hypothetical protein